MSDDRMPGPESPNEWLRHRLTELGDLSGYTVPEVREIVAGQVRLDDLRYWTKPGLESRIRLMMREFGYLVSPSEKGEDQRAAPVSTVEQLEFDGMVAVLRSRRVQAVHDYEAAYKLATEWTNAHPDAGVTAEHLMRAAGWAMP